MGLGGEMKICGRLTRSMQGRLPHGPSSRERSFPKLSLEPGKPEHREALARKRTQSETGGW